MNAAYLYARSPDEQLAYLFALSTHTARILIHHDLLHFLKAEFKNAFAAPDECAPQTHPTFRRTSEAHPEYQKIALQ
jgi:hypothetical protein